MEKAPARRAIDYSKQRIFQQQSLVQNGYLLMNSATVLGSTEFLLVTP
jgi:hypothetical protein